MRRAPGRRRFRLWKFFRRGRKGICRARRRVGGPGRRTVEFCWAIRRPSTRTMRTRIAALSPKDAVAVPSLAATAACLATWAGGLLFGVDGVAATVSLYRMAGDASLAAATASLAATVRLRSRTLLGPVVPRERSEGFTRLPRCRFRMSLTADPVTAWHIRLDSPPPPEMRQRGQSVPAGASPRSTPECTTIPEAAPGHRQPQAAAAASLPDFHRPSVVQSVGRLLPTTRPQGHKWTASELHPAPRRHQEQNA